MKLEFCALCGATENLNHHHVVPKVKGGTDEEENILTLCPEHHGMIHMVSPGSWAHRRELQKIGIEKAKLKGVYKGRQPSIDYEKVKRLWEQGIGATEIAKQMNIHRDSVYRIVPKEPYRKSKSGQYLLGV